SHLRLYDPCAPILLGYNLRTEPKQLQQLPTSYTNFYDRPAPNRVPFLAYPIATRARKVAMRHLRKVSSDEYERALRDRANSDEAENGHRSQLQRQRHCRSPRVA